MGSLCDTDRSLSQSNDDQYLTLERTALQMVWPQTKAISIIPVVVLSGDGKDCVRMKGYVVEGFGGDH